LAGANYLDVRPSRAMARGRVAGATDAGAGLAIRPGRAHVERTDLANLESLSLEQFRPYVTGIYTKYFWSKPGEEHYKLLAHFSTHYHGATFIDLGTSFGCSALALAYNPANRVISYDLEDKKEAAIDLPNVEFRVKNALEDGDQLLASPLILLDTYHDGVFEQEMYDFLSRNNYTGLLLLDDIHVNPAMQQFWSGVSHTKLDLTTWGHWSGTGLVVFDMASSTLLGSLLTPSAA
jgi:hypothetical protein